MRDTTDKKSTEMEVKKINEMNEITQMHRVMGVGSNTVGFFPGMSRYRVDNSKDKPVNLGKPPLLFMVQKVSSSTQAALYFVFDTTVTRVAGNASQLSATSISSTYAGGVIITPQDNSSYIFFVLCSHL